MSVTVYSLGDHEVIRAALTGVAMIFDPSQNMLTGSGILGLGQFAGFGLLISFAFVVCGIVLKQKIELEHVVLTAIVYAVLFVPSTTVNVEDMHTGQVAVVDNVPIGVAYPGGIISTFTHKVAITIEQVMKDASSDYIPQTDVGFVAPLKLLLATRNAAAGDPYFAKNYNNFLADCVIPGVDGRAAANLTDLSDFFVDVTTSNMNVGGAATLYFSSNNNNGDVKSCTDASTALQTDLSNIISGTDTSISSNVQLSTMEGRVNAAMDKKPGTGTPVWSSGDISNAIASVGGSGVNAQKMMTSLILGDLTFNTFNCGKMGTTEYIQCTAALGQAMEQYKTDAAGKASMFQKTMIPSMNVFMFMFFAFAPLIALIVAMSGMRGIVMIVPKYMLFGLWTQSWIPAAAIINYFIQRQTQEAIAGRLVRGDGIPLSNVMELYNTLGIKVAAASDLLAQAPILTLALIGGSMFALAQMAGKTGDSFDEKVSSPDMLKNGPVSQVDARSVMAADMTTSGQTSVVGPGGFAHMAGAKSMLSIGVSSQFGQQFMAEQSRGLERASQMEAKFASSAGSEFGSSSTAAHIVGSGSSSNSSFEHGSGFSFDFSRNLAQGTKKTLSETEQNSLAFSLNALAGATSSALVAGARQGLGGSALKNFVNESVKAFSKNQLGNLASKAGAALPDAKIIDGYMSKLDQSLDENLSEKSSQMNNWAAKASEGTMSRDESSIAEQVQHGFKSSYSQQLSKAQSEKKSYSEGIKASRSLSNSSSAGFNANEQDVGRLAAQSPGLQSWLESDAQSQGFNEGQIQAAANQVGKDGHFQSTNGNPSAFASERRAAGIARLISGRNHSGLAVRLAAAAAGEVEPTGSVHQGNGSAASAASAYGGLTDGSDIQGSVQSGLSSSGDVGLSDSQRGQINSAASRSAASASQAHGAEAGAQGRTASIAAAANSGPTEQDFNNNVNRAESSASGSGVEGAYRSQVMSGTPSAEFNKGAAAMQQHYRQDMGFRSLISKFGDQMMDNPALSAIAAVGGAAAVADVLSSISNHHLGGFGGKGMSLPEYGKKVLSRLGAPMARVGEKALARHGVATAVGLPEAGVGAIVTNAAMLAWDVTDVVSAVKDAMKEVDAGLTGGDPVKYVGDTLKK